MDLPARRVEINRVKFNEDERKLYDAMHKDGKLIVCKYVLLYERVDVALYLSNRFPLKIF